MSLNSKELNFVRERYEQLIGNTSVAKICKKITEELEVKFGRCLSSQTILNTMSENNFTWTRLHDFFDLMISDFKTKYHNEDHKKPSRLLRDISRFIEKEYNYGGPLSRYERCILSNVIDKREDVVFTDKTSRSLSQGGKSKGKIGYLS